MSLAKKLKMIIKGEPKPSFGTDPNEPWSVRAGITESEKGMLHSYLKSRGINPEFVSKDTKISHAKSSEFTKWKNDHQFDDPADYVSSVAADKMRAQREEVDLEEAKDYPYEYRATYHDPDTRKISHLMDFKHKSLEAAKKHAEVSRLQRKDGKEDILHSVIQKEEIEILEAVDKEDTITFDIPLLIRMFEYAREDAKTDMDLHKVTEKLISIRDKGTLTMADYEFVTKLKESVEIMEKKDPCWTGYTQVGMKNKGGREVPNCVPSKGVPKAKGYKSVKEAKTIQGTALDKFRIGAAERAKKHIETQKNQSKDGSGMTSAIDRLQKHMNKEETELDEMDQKFIDSLNKLSHTHKPGDQVTVNSKFFGKQKGKVTKVDSQSVHVMRDGKNSAEKYPHDAVMKEDVEQIDELKMSTVKSLYQKRRADFHGDQVGKKKKGKEVSANNVKTSNSRLMGFKPTSEDVYQDSQAATQTVGDMGTQADDREPTYSKKQQMSKSARIIKSIYKKNKMVKEDLYDHEKEDKSVATYGKKPKVEKLEQSSDKEDQAAMVLKGGTTLTGQTRDTLEIDPVMRKANKNNNK